MRGATSSATAEPALILDDEARRSTSTNQYKMSFPPVKERMHSKRKDSEEKRVVSLATAATCAFYDDDDVETRTTGYPVFRDDDDDSSSNTTIVGTTLADGTSSSDDSDDDEKTTTDSTSSSSSTSQAPDIIARPSKRGADSPLTTWTAVQKRARTDPWTLDAYLPRAKSLLKESVVSR